MTMQASGGSRISRRGGRGPVRGAVDPRHGRFLTKMYANTKKLGSVGGGGGGRVPGTPPRSANAGTHSDLINTLILITKKYIYVRLYGHG